MSLSVSGAGLLVSGSGGGTGHPCSVTLRGMPPGRATDTFVIWVVLLSFWGNSPTYAYALNPQHTHTRRKTAQPGGGNQPGSHSVEKRGWTAEGCCCRIDTQLLPSPSHPHLLPLYRPCLPLCASFLSCSVLIRFACLAKEVAVLE